MFRAPLYLVPRRVPGRSYRAQRDRSIRRKLLRRTLPARRTQRRLVIGIAALCHNLTRTQPARCTQRQRRLGQILVEAGLASASDIHQALQQQAAAGGRLGAILVASNRVTPGDLAWAVAQQQGLPFINLQEDGGQGLYALNPQLFHMMPRSFWRVHLLIPWRLHEDQLTGAMVNPDDEEALGQLRAATGWRIHRAVTGYRDIVASLQRI